MRFNIDCHRLRSSPGRQYACCGRQHLRLDVCRVGSMAPAVAAAVYLRASQVLFERDSLPLAQDKLVSAGGGGGMLVFTKTRGDAKEVRAIEKTCFLLLANFWQHPALPVAGVLELLRRTRRFAASSLERGSAICQPPQGSTLLVLPR